MNINKIKLCQKLKKQSRELVGEVLTVRIAQNLAKGKPVIFFLLAIIIDIIGHNIPYEFDLDGNLTSSYWYKYNCLNSLSFVGYILFSFVASQKYNAALKIITFNWLGFAIGDLFQEILCKNECHGITYILDWLIFGIFAISTIIYFSIKNLEIHK
jgi:hypothetical protein